MELGYDEVSDMSIKDSNFDQSQPDIVRETHIIIDGEAQTFADGGAQSFGDGGKVHQHATDSGLLQAAEGDGFMPKVGMIFKSLQEALDYYDKYARRVGFTIVRRSSKFRDDGQFDSLVLACTSGGKPRSMNDGPSRRACRITKTNCRAKMVIRLPDDGFFHVGYLILDHNHEVNPSKIAFMKSKRVSVDVDLDTNNHSVTSKMSKDLALIEKISSALISIGCPSHIFAPESFLYQGCLTSGQFAGYLRILSHHTETAKLKHVMEAAVRNRAIIAIQSMTFAHLMNFLSWLKTPQGREVLRSAVYDEKQSTRTKYTSFSADQMAEVEAFDAFLDEYETTLKGKREIMECAIEKLTSRIQQEKESCEFDLANYRQQFHPVSVFSPLGADIVNRRCWDHWCAPAEVAGEASPLLTFSSMDKAIELFSEEVKMEHILQFIQQGENLQKIQAWIVSKVHFFRQSGDERAVTRYRHLLEAMGVADASDAAPLSGIVTQDSYLGYPISGTCVTSVQQNLDSAR